AGPEGSGRTTTLSAALDFLKRAGAGVMTVAEQAESRRSLAEGLRQVLRHEPDVVLVGELPDAETATLAFQAAQAGRMVLSTLDAKDAPAALTRLVEMGVPA